MPSTPTYRKKLIEVDLPLDAINKEASREKSIRHGHPSTLHLWWARRPLAACRAVIFASIVDDPSSCPDEFPDLASQNAKRQQLHDLVEQLVKWENSNNENLLAIARKEIAISVARSRNDKPPTSNDDVRDYLLECGPTIYDPFCGGGSIPLEAQRLGLKVVGSDLNPVAVVITKALIELPPKFANRPPINPSADLLGVTNGKSKNQPHARWRGTAGLADDIRFFGKWVRDYAFKRIGHHYPDVNLADGSKTPALAWLWARTVPCSNPACPTHMPMLKSFKLSSRTNNRHWLRPVLDKTTREFNYEIQNHDFGIPDKGTVDRNGAICLACGNAVDLPYVRERAKSGEIGQQMIATVVSYNRKKHFIAPDDEQRIAGNSSKPTWRPSQQIAKTPKVSALSYGATSWDHLFSERQLLALTTLSDAISELRLDLATKATDDQYVNALITYLAFALTKTTTRNCSYNRWDNTKDIVVGLFGRQAIPMIWDFAEANPFSNSNGSFMIAVEGIAKVIERLPADLVSGDAHQADATTATYSNVQPVVVTDPPYYDNISYADLSDFFYVWLRPLLRDIYPGMFSGILTPKSEEMIVAPRFKNGRKRFEEGLSRALKTMQFNSNIDVPSSIVYGYKQQEHRRGEHASTGWDTMLNAVINAGYEIVGTWPMRTELANRQNSLDTNSLASSVIIVIRPRPNIAQVSTRQHFLEELNVELPIALDRLTRGGRIAPADLPQAAIGPGMEIYSKYERVETISGELVTVREALQQINRVIGAYFDREEGELDRNSRFCVDWLKTHGYAEGRYGEADNIGRAKNVSIPDIANIHQLVDNKRRGIIKLHPISQYHPDRKYPMTDLTAWEGCMRMAYHLDTSNEDGEGIPGCGKVGRLMAGNIDSIERLARILYNHYDNLNQPRNAYIYNQLVSEWQNILDASQSPEQGQLN